MKKASTTVWNVYRERVDEIKLLPEETSDEGKVVWKRYEYVETGKTGPDGKEQKKIALVQNATKGTLSLFGPASWALPIPFISCQVAKGTV